MRCFEKKDEQVKVFSQRNTFDKRVEQGEKEVEVVGMACRFPGADDYDTFWQNLVEGCTSVCEVPGSRWDWRDFWGDPARQGNKMYAKWGGFMDDVDCFDPLFFGMAPKEADYLDPQHRIFLQAVWHAIEDAGYAVSDFAKRRVGVYAGVSKNDYSELMREYGHSITPFVSTGTVHSILTNRVSFLFDFRGRSESIDTACSSALVALHRAVSDIGTGEVDCAVVGGVNALLSPAMFISHSKAWMLSPDGLCKSFDRGANGYVRG